MNRQEALQEIRGQWEYLLRQITGPAKQRVNGKQSYICPICGHGTNGDGLTFNPKGSRPGTLKCFGSCGFSGDIIDLYGKYYGKDFAGALELCASELGLEIDAYNPTESAQRDFSDAARTITESSAKVVLPNEDVAAIT